MAMKLRSNYKMSWDSMPENMVGVFAVGSLPISTVSRLCTQFAPKSVSRSIDMKFSL